jgi:hypothetical protein
MCIDLSFLPIEKDRPAEMNFPPEIDTFSKANPGLGLGSLADRIS